MEELKISKEIVNITLQDLLEVGAHFGHPKSKWHPKMAPFIFTKKEGIHIIDLHKTQEYLKKAIEFVINVVRNKGTILFIGTKRQAKEIVKKAAESCAMPYVVDRWLGGTFTNFQTLHRQFLKLQELEEKVKKEDFKKYTKFEQNRIQKELERMKKLFGGIKTMEKLPEAIFVVDVVVDNLAVNEARKMGIKVIALVDTNANPDLVDYPIPSNDDAKKVIELMVNTIAKAINEGRKGAMIKEKK